MMSLANFLSQSKNKIKRTDRVHRFRILFITRSRSDYNSFTHNDNDNHNTAVVLLILEKKLFYFLPETITESVTFTRII